MSVEKTNNTDSQAKYLAQKRRELEDEKNALELERSRMETARSKIIKDETDKTERSLVEISKNAEQKYEIAKKINSDRVHQLNNSSQEHYQKLADSAQKQMQLIDNVAEKTINDHRLTSMEKIRQITEQSEDPFYRIQSLNPEVSEDDSIYKVNIKLPKHELENLFVVGEGNTLKVSLSRRFQEAGENPEAGRKTKTNSYQSVVEQIALREPIDVKKIQKTYSEGMVTITAPKIKAGLPV
ncbi:MAG: Hsp20/alpha crystallin family protein [Oligoflexia bacterium]|nr:Hsp20/alpha crystallin family protein [Oligoflexia bacterium]